MCSKCLQDGNSILASDEMEENEDEEEEHDDDDSDWEPSVPAIESVTPLVPHGRPGAWQDRGSFRQVRTITHET